MRKGQGKTVFAPVRRRSGAATACERVQQIGYGGSPSKECGHVSHPGRGSHTWSAISILSTPKHFAVEREAYKACHERHDDSTPGTEAWLAGPMAARARRRGCGQPWWPQRARGANAQWAQESEDGADKGLGGRKFAKSLKKEDWHSQKCARCERCS